jgi:hypothetical protein
MPLIPYDAALAGVIVSDKVEYNTTGWVLMATMLGLIVTSLPPIRRAAFNLFYYTHWVLFLTCSAAAVVHSAVAVWWGVGFWLADLAIRYVYMAGACLPVGGCCKML